MITSEEPGAIPLTNVVSGTANVMIPSPVTAFLSSNSTPDSGSVKLAAVDCTVPSGKTYPDEVDTN